MYDPLRLHEIESRGMLASFWASEKPNAPAVYDRFGSKTFAEVNANANGIVRLLRNHGVQAGDHIAFLTSNRAEVMEIMPADLRGGYRLTPVNRHLTTEEALYIFDRQRLDQHGVDQAENRRVGADPEPQRQQHHDSERR